MTGIQLMFPCPDVQRLPERLRAAHMTRGNNLNALSTAIFVGIARRAFEESVAYAKERYKGGAKIIHHRLRSAC